MRVLFLNGGYCRQLQALVDRRTWRMTRFHAVFLAVEHPGRGWVLVDTGYSTHFVAASKSWPRVLYRIATPVTSLRTTADVLRASGIEAGEVSDVILTHFHADHIGGVRDFPNARFHHANNALAPLRSRGAFGQTLHAFLPDLLPEDFPSRSNPIPDDAFVNDIRLGIGSHDVFGDESLYLVRLPGHAPGHCGVFIPRADKGPLLFAADAFWHHREIEEGTQPLLPARLMLHDGRAYEATKKQLRSIAASGIRVVACHCPKTQILIG